jgi:hypothetical protein
VSQKRKRFSELVYLLGVTTAVGPELMFWFISAFQEVD